MDTVADPTTTTARAVDDESIRQRLAEALAEQDWWNATWSRVAVDDGVVTYGGMIGEEAERAAARAVALGIRGVRSVADDRIRAMEWQMAF